jgi:hypothetical protein
MNLYQPKPISFKRYHPIKGVQKTMEIEFTLGSNVIRIRPMYWSEAVIEYVPDSVVGKAEY